MKILNIWLNKKPNNKKETVEKILAESIERQLHELLNDVKKLVETIKQK
jgi:hypothetical protein